MSSPRDPVARRVRRSALLATGLVAVVIVGGCTGGRPEPVASPASPVPPSPVPPASDPLASPGEPSRPAPTASGAAPTPRVTAPSPGQALGGPPAAVLEPPVGDAVPGDLGGYTWAGSGSDAPWLVPPAERAVRSRGPYAVVLDPPLPLVGWMARWAPVLGRAAGDPVGFDEGGPGPILLEGPTGPGRWTMQVDARFAGGGRAAWYWLIRLDP